MNAYTRQKKILEFVRTETTLSVNRLVDRVGASPATVRRDLVALEEAGKLIRTHGAVMDRHSLTGEASFSVKRERIPVIKRRIGQAVAKHIPEGSSVFVDAGSTCLEAGLALLEQGGRTIYTNSLPLLFNAEKAGAPLVSIGGQLRAISGAMVGALALDWLVHLRFDYAVIGASALDSDAGAMTTELAEAGVKRAVIERAKHSILVADSDKLEQSASIQFASWTDFRIWVTDAKVPASMLRSLRLLRSLSIHQID